MKNLLICVTLLLLTACESNLRLPDENPNNLNSEENLADGKFKSYNKFGWIVNDLDEISIEFLDDVDENSTILEIGAGFGYVSKKAIQKGAKAYVNDLEKGNLDVFAKNLTIAEKAKTTLLAGKFPDNFGLKNNSIDEILAQRVMHYLTPEEFEKGLAIIHKLLKDDGKFYMTIDSPYTKKWEGFIPEFEMRKRGFDKYPGFTKDVGKYDKELSQSVKYMNFLDLELAQRRIQEAGFEVLDAIYLNDTAKYYSELRLDGREAVGIVAKKISNN